MITVLTGENSFEIERALFEITNSFKGDVERLDGNSLQLAQLPDILMGVSLFAISRTIIIRNLSENKLIWSVFGDWIPKISDDIQLVLVESKLDKRTLTFKSLKKCATIQEFNQWNERDSGFAEKWVIKQANQLNFELDKNCARALVQRVGVDQWQLFYAIEKLAVVDNITVDVIQDVVEANPVENVFNLLDTAIRGDMAGVQDMIEIFEHTEDVYRLFGLLSTQVFQLAAVVYAAETDDVAKDFGVHPYVVSKLMPVAKKIGKSGVAKIIEIFAQADDDMKISKAEPWLLVERALMKVASI